MCRGGARLERGGTMSQVPDDKHYRMIAKLLVGGAVVPFLGAGVNLCGRPESVEWKVGRFLPSGGELAAYLAREVDVDLGRLRGSPRGERANRGDQVRAVRVATRLSALFSNREEPSSAERSDGGGSPRWNVLLMSAGAVPGMLE